MPLKTVVTKVKSNRGIKTLLVEYILDDQCGPKLRAEQKIWELVVRTDKDRLRSKSVTWSHQIRVRQSPRVTEAHLAASGSSEWHALFGQWADGGKLQICRNFGRLQQARPTGWLSCVREVLIPQLPAGKFREINAFLPENETRKGYELLLIWRSALP